MANYSDNRWNAFRYKVDQIMQMPEFKYKPAPTLMKFLKNTDFLVPASQKEAALGVKQSDQDTVELNIINKQSISTGAARAYNHTGSKNDGTKTTVSFTTTAADFTFSKKEAGRTIWDEAEIVSKQLRSAAIALHDQIETTLLAYLNTNKSQVVTSASPRSGDWDAANYIFGISNADYDYWMQKIRGFMREQYYRGLEIETIIDETLWQRGEFLMQQGAGNATNLSWQMAGLNPGESPTQELTLDSGYVGMGYAFPMGTIGLLPWIPQQNIAGMGAPGLAGGLYTSIPDPLGSGLTFAVHEWQEGADNEGASGETQDIDVHVELSVDLGPVLAPMSTANASTVFKYGVKQ